MIADHAEAIEKKTNRELCPMAERGHAAAPRVVVKRDQPSPQQAARHPGVRRSLQDQQDSAKRKGSQLRSGKTHSYGYGCIAPLPVGILNDAAVGSRGESVMVVGNIDPFSWSKSRPGSKSRSVAAVIDDRYPPSSQVAYISGVDCDRIGVRTGDVVMAYPYGDDVTPTRGDIVITEMRSGDLTATGLAEVLPSKGRSVALRSLVADVSDADIGRPFAVVIEMRRAFR
jgi:hypothetical protein